MKITLVTLIALLLGGCMSSPSWWITDSSYDPEVMDFYLWQRHIRSWPYAHCAMASLTYNFPPEKTGPVISAVYRRAKEPEERLDIIGGLSDAYPPNTGARMKAYDSVIKILQAGTNDPSHEIRQASEEVLRDWKKVYEAEHPPAN